MHDCLNNEVRSLYIEAQYGYLEQKDACRIKSEHFAERGKKSLARTAIIHYYFSMVFFPFSLIESAASLISRKTVEPRADSTVVSDKYDICVLVPL